MISTHNETLKYKTVLALDCCFETASIAIYDARKEKHQIYSASQDKNPQKQHGDIVFELLESHLRENNITLKCFDALSVTIGPGRFNGIRVGIALMKALSLATNKPLLGFSTLLINAKQVAQNINKKKYPNNYPITIIQKARQDSVIIQTYDTNIKPLDEPATMLVKEVCKYIRQKIGKSKCLHLGGELAEQYYQQSCENNPLSIDEFIVYKTDNHINAKTLALIAAKQEFKPQKPQPLYLRHPHITKPKQKLTAT